MASTTTGALGPWWVHPHISVRNTAVTLLGLYKQQISFTVWKSWAHTEEQTRNSSELGKTNSSRVVLLVHSETKPAERKGRRISCAQGVNCRYSVPPKTKTRGTIQCFTHTHAHTCTHAHTYTHALTQLKTRLPSVGNSSNKRNRSKLLLNLFDSIYFLFWPIVVQENISILNLVMYCRVSSIGKKHRGIASFIASVQTKVMEIFFFFSFPFLLQEYIGDHCFP